MPEQNNLKPIDKLSKYLAIILSSIAIIAGIGSFINSQASKAVVNYKVEQNEKEIEKLKVKTEPIPVIQTDIKNIAEDVEDVKDIVESIRDKLIPTH